jgi:hypothetical protein
MMEIIRGLRFTCSNKVRGCPEILAFRDIARHEKQICKFKKQIQAAQNVRLSIRAKTCQICRDTTLDDMNASDNECSEDEEEKKSDMPLHICHKKERQMLCKNHKRTASYFTEDRIINPELLHGPLGKNLKCELCKNLLRRPMFCKDCNTNFCKVCISNELINNPSQGCPFCEVQNPKFEKVHRNVAGLLDRF